jgi:hypothetical protein
MSWSLLSVHQCCGGYAAAPICATAVLPRTLREAGLVDVAAAGSFPVGGAVCDRLEIATMRQVRAELAAARLADEAEIDAHVAAAGGRELDLTLAPLISAWGRRPG